MGVREKTQGRQLTRRVCFEKSSHLFSTSIPRGGGTGYSQGITKINVLALLVGGGVLARSINTRKGSGIKSWENFGKNVVGNGKNDSLYTDEGKRKVKTI